MFADIEENEIINTQKINEILKNLYESNFFKDVSVNFEENFLRITVTELPIIDKITYNGIKAKKIKEAITKNLKLKPRSSYNTLILAEDNKVILNTLRDLGYFFSKIETFAEEKKDNKIDIRYEISLGEKAKIKKISFIGNKIFKDRKLKNIIISEEYKFWKIISGKKFLNQNIINFDERLLRNFYLNRGYYNVNINSSFARVIEEDEFELIFNIDANEKIYFGDFKLSIPDDFEKIHFEKLNKIFGKNRNEPYSINAVEQILNTIDEITLTEEYKSINATVEENVALNKINLNFIIQETDKFFVEKINIFGNNITRENVIRNQLELDEGDQFNLILQKRS